MRVGLHNFFGISNVRQAWRAVSPECCWSLGRICDSGQHKFLLHARRQTARRCQASASVIFRRFGMLSAGRRRFSRSSSTAGKHASFCMAARDPPLRQIKNAVKQRQCSLFESLADMTVSSFKHLARTKKRTFVGGNVFHAARASMLCQDLSDARARILRWI